DETMARAAARLLMNFLSWDPGGSTSLGHNDEPATEFVRYCPRVYDWIYPVLTTEERETCRDVMQARMAEMYGRWDNRPFERFPYESHNMGYYLPDMLEASLAMAGDLDTEEMLRYCMMQLWSPYYPPYGGDDGGWQEGPPYWGWVADVFARTCYLVEQNTGAPIAQRSSLRNQAMWKLYANPPHAKMSPFGDGQAGASGGAGTMYRLAALYQDPYALWFASQKNYSPSGLEAWMWDVSDLEPREPIDLPQSKCFPSVGEACMHSALWSPADNVQLLFRSCPFGGISHAYADQNTFALDAFGEPLIIASGYYPYYGSPHHVQWTRKTVASNSVLVNGEGQPETWNWDARGEITRFESSAYADYAVGQAKEAYPGILNDFRRRILFARPLLTGGPAIIAIHDELAAEEPSGYQWMLHSLDEMAVDETRQRVTVRRADARCRVDYLLPRGLAFSQTDQFTVPPERGDPNQWHLTASLEEKATERQSLLVILPHRARESETLPESEAVDGEGCVAARVRDEGIEHILIFKAPGADMAVIPEMGLRTDAEAVALTLEGGRARASFAAGGTMLEVGGTRLAMPTTGEVTTPSAPASRLVLEDGTTIEMPVEVFPLVGRARYSARYDGPTGHHELVVRARRSRAKPCPITVGAGKTESRWTPENSDDWQEHVTPLMDIATGARIGLTLDSTEGGNCEVESVTVRRAYGRNLLPNASFEDISPSGAVLGWRAGTITNDAQSTLESAEDGRDGSRCARITCTKAGGDFGAYVGWPGVSPVDYDRRFRVGVWVRNDAESSVGIQITDVSWQFHQTTNKIADNAEWTETSREFTLPAGEDLTNLRLHMHAEREGAVMRVDDAYLVELPPE
ncbi:MAG TPA: DUF4962 domain-containing protein, partial [Armatimonadota bacterium]|nr:DUF4962 domain-containing protein [Armatimonadota bacterium]